MTKLNSRHDKRVSWEKEQQLASQRLVASRFPWLLKLSGSTPAQQLETVHHDPHQQDHALVFTHQHRSAGGPLVSCLKTHAENSNLSLAPALSSDSQHSDDAVRVREAHDIHAGKFTFGACDSYRDRRCSYFSMFREPMARAISSYEYCKSALADELCGVVNANQASLRQWILHHGSLTLVQLTASPTWCQQPISENLTLAEDDEEKVVSMLLKPEEYPCWYKQKLHLDELDDVSRRQLTDYVVDHLHSWFHVVGITEHFTVSMKMFEETFQIPFSSCEKTHSATSSNIHDNRANRKRRRVLKDDDYDNDPELLLYDYEVQQALDADKRIYNQALHIFHIQKQLQFNDLTVDVHR